MRPCATRTTHVADSYRHRRDRALPFCHDTGLYCAPPMRRPATALVTAMTLSATAPCVHAQSSTGTSSTTAAPDPVHIVSDALAGQRPLQRQATAYTAAAPHDWPVPLRTVR